MSTHPRSVLAAVTAAALASALPGQMAWSQAAPASRPPACYDHGLVFDATRDRVVLFGGNRLFSPTLDDTWEWNGTDWSLRSTPVRPPARGGHGMAFDLDRGRAVLFGGLGPGGMLRADTWEWDGSAWNQRQPTQSPPPLQHLALAYDVPRRRTLLFGGHDGAANRNETWIWDGNDWARRFPAASPPALSGHALVCHAPRQVTLLFLGGNSYWEWNGNDWTPRTTPTAPPAAATAGAVCYDDLRQRVVLHVPWLFPGPETWEFDGHDWRRLSAPGSPSPVRRDSIALAYDTARGRVVGFGGWHFHSATVFDDTWEYGPTTTAAVSLVGNGCAGVAGVPIAVPDSPAIVGNRDFAVRVAPVVAAAPVWLAFALQPAQRLLSGGCVQRVEPPVLSLSAIASSGGVALVPAALPADPALGGLVLHAQALVVDGGGALFGLGAVSQGLTIRIGD